MAQLLPGYEPQKSTLSAAGWTPSGAPLRRTRGAASSDEIPYRCDHSVTSLRAVTLEWLREKALTCGYVVGMRGFEPRISGPPDPSGGVRW